MKNLNAFLASTLVLAALLFSACSEDPEPPAPVGPTVLLAGDAGFVSSVDTLEAGATFVVKLSAQQGDASLNSITVQENGATISDLSRITFDGFPAGSNPSPIPQDDAAGFTWEIEVVADTNADVTNTYSFNVQDAAGLDAEVSVEIVTFDPSTPVTEKTMVLLLNQAGPAGTGGLDLHTGIGTGSMDSTADIKDNGIDINQSLDKNWYQTISPVNASDLRAADASFNYDAITTQEEIQAAFEMGTSITTSKMVVTTDQFLVLSGGTYFALKVTNVEVTAADNGDYYEFSVKQ